jgi:putative nucleotidyltransferase with HDIG domain
MDIRSETVHAVLDAAEKLDRSGSIDEAAACYLEAIELARSRSEHSALVRALRKLAVLRRLQGDHAAARSLCEESFGAAVAAGDDVLAAEALNVRAVIDYETGNMDGAHATYLDALKLGGADRSLRARVEQNLGILSNVQGDLDDARSHYERSLDAYRQISDYRGCGQVYHNLGMLHADRKQWEDADEYLDRSRDIAGSLGDGYLEALCGLNQAEVRHARGLFPDALAHAENALHSFEKMGAVAEKADSYRVIGMVYRDTSRHVLAEARLRMARELASSAGSALIEAETCRELALLNQAMGRNKDALQLLNSAHRLFSSLDARLDLVDVGGKREKLEDTYLDVVREWGQSIESADSYTFGHCGRVADYAVAVAAQLGLGEEEQTVIRLGAYLHDLGKIRVPHEILNKPGRLTDEEFDVIKQHPVWGLELLDGIEFPWDIKPMIRWHHEKYDGTGYPDRLKGDEIPLEAQILCAADVFDALTSTRSYRGALSLAEAMSRMESSRDWWRADVYEAFVTATRKAPAATALSHAA